MRVKAKVQKVRMAIRVGEWLGSLVGGAIITVAYLAAAVIFAAIFEGILETARHL